MLNVELTPLYPWQMNFMGVDPATGTPLPFDSLIPINMASCGSKAGKSAGTATGLILRFLNEQVSCLWSAPVNKQLEPIWRRYMRPVFSKIPKNLVRIQETWGRWSVEIRGTDAALYLMSGEDPDSLRGSSYKYAVIDEAARYPLDSFDSVMTTLTDQNGVLWGISTPKRHGRNQEASWFKREFLDGRRQERDLRSGERRTNRSLQVSTWENPMPAVQARAAFLRDKYGEDSQFYREEVMGEILESDGSVFRHIVKTHRSVPTAYQDGHVYCYGWDPALGGDGSVISIWDIGERREVHLETLPAQDWPGQIARLAYLIRSYQCSRGRFDASSLGGSVTVQQLREKGIPGTPVSFNQHNKGEYVQALSLAMEADEPRFLPDETAMREMENYAFTVLPSGIVRYRAVEGKHDDVVAARILAWKELTAPGYQVYGEEEAIEGEAAAEIESEHLRDTFTPSDDMESLFRRCGALGG